MSQQLNCPNCTMGRSAVIDSRTNAEGDRIRRRRTCAACGHRWTTYEVDAALLHRLSIAAKLPGTDSILADIMAVLQVAAERREKALTAALEANPQRYYFDKRRLTFPGTPAPKPVTDAAVTKPLLDAVKLSEPQIASEGCIDLHRPA